MTASRPKLRLTLFVPDLLRPPPPADAFGAGSDADCPTLSALLTRARLTRQAASSSEAALCAQFGLTPTGAAPRAGSPVAAALPLAALPLAALRLRGEDAPAAAALATQTGWLCADPVHLRLLHDRMVLADSHAFSIDDDEARALVGRLNEHFAARDGEPGVEFLAASGDRWYVRWLDAGDAATVEEAPHRGLHRGPHQDTERGAQRATNNAANHDTQAIAAPDMPPLSAVAGRSLRQHLPETAALAPWRRLLLEAQMVLAADPVNAGRAARGELPVNSLWLWGAGDAAAPAPAAPFSNVWADSPLARGLARHCGVALQPLPQTSDDWLAASTGGGEHLAVCEALRGPALLDDEAAWCAAINELERQWFIPLAAALRGGRLLSLDIVAPTLLGLLHWQITPTDRWQFWRRPRTLAALARELAASGGTTEARNPQ